MIAAILRFALRYRLLVSLFFVAVCVAGAIALTRIPIDAFPDISPNLVQVFAEVEGAAAEEVEQLVSRPVEVAMMGIPGVKKIRSANLSMKAAAFLGAMSEAYLMSGLSFIILRSSSSLMTSARAVLMRAAPFFIFERRA